METTPPPNQTAFFIAKLVEYIVRTHVSYDKAFKTIVKRYGIPRWLLTTYYRLGYYAALYYYSLRWIARKRNYGSTPAAIALFFRDIGFSVRRLTEIVEEEVKNLGVVKALSLKYSFPEYFVRDLLNHVDYRELEQILRKLNERSIWVRINLLKTSRKEALSCLREEGLKFSINEKLDYMVKIESPKWVSIGKIKCVKEGLVVPQDLASAWVVELFTRTYSEDDLIVDLCSAPGLKLGLEFMLNKPSRSLSIDLSWRRINVLCRLSRIQGIPRHRVVVVNSDGREIKFTQLAKSVLVDAPCSGSGAVSNDPAIKISIERRGKLEYYSSLQRKLLGNAIRNISSKYIVYSVCSLHPLEGEQVIEDIVRKGFVEVYDMGDLLPRGYRGYSVSKYTYRTYPHVMGSQGFYIAVLKLKRVM